jgi:transposase-like protein
MSKKQPKKYSKEFKMETLALARSSDKTDSQLERELGLSRGCLYNWRKEDVRRLREKVELDPSRPTRILTVPGLGYRLIG